MTFITYEQANQIIAEIGQLKSTVASNQQRGNFVNALLAQSGIDGSITPGDIFTGAGFVTMYTGLGTGCGASTGVLTNAIFHWGASSAGLFVRLGTAGGFLVGAAVVGWKLFKDYTFVPGPETPEEETETDAEYGLRIVCKNDNTVTFLLLLPDVKRPIIEKMVRDTARLYWNAQGKEMLKQRAFSQRKTGKPFGDRLGEVKAILEKSGHVTPAPNSTYQFTPRGRAWLTDYL